MLITVYFKIILSLWIKIILSMCKEQKIQNYLRSSCRVRINQLLFTLPKFKTLSFIVNKSPKFNNIILPSNLKTSIIRLINVKQVNRKFITVVKKCRTLDQQFQKFYSTLSRWIIKKIYQNLMSNIFKYNNKITTIKEMIKDRLKLHWKTSSNLQKNMTNCRNSTIN